MSINKIITTIIFKQSSKEYLEELKTMQQLNHNIEVAFMPEDGGTVKSSNWNILDAEEGVDIEDNPISHMKYRKLNKISISRYYSIWFKYISFDIVV
jgi:hypothetical protein